MARFFSLTKFIGFIFVLLVTFSAQRSHAGDDLTVEYQTGLGIRASFQGGVLHVEWDSVPTTVNGQAAPDYNLVIINDYSCGLNNSELPLCPFNVGTTFRDDSDITIALLEGAYPIEFPVSVTIAANGVYGQLVGKLRTPPISMEKVQPGDKQSGSVNKQLKDPFIVQAKRLGSNLQAGYLVGVRWQVISAPPGARNYQVVPAFQPDQQWPYGNGFEAFNSAGKSGAFFIVGDQPGEYKIEASCSWCDNGSGTSAIFTATTQKPKLAIDSGDGQTGRIGTALKQMLVVKVTDQDGKGVPDKRVSFSLSPPLEPVVKISQLSNTTDPDGKIKASMTLGKKSGKSYSVIATCGECDPQTVSFTENAAKVKIDLTAESLALAPTGTTGNNVSLLSAKVSDSFGDFPDYSLNLEVKFQPQGHDHHETEPPKGILSPSSCTTDSNGQCPTAYMSSEVAGIASVVARSAWEENQSNTQELIVSVSGLEPLNPASYTLKPIESDIQKKHPSPYFAAADVILKMNDLGLRYSSDFPNEEILTVTDASLQDGGLYDILGNWTPEHFEHREGREIDIRTKRPGRSGIPLDTQVDEKNRTVRFNEDFERSAKDAGVKNAKVHKPLTIEEHYHLNF